MIHATYVPTTIRDNIILRGNYPSYVCSVVHAHTITCTMFYARQTIVSCLLCVIKIKYIRLVHGDPIVFNNRLSDFDNRLLTIVCASSVLARCARDP